MKVLRLTTALEFGGIEKVFEVFAENYQGKHEYVFMSCGHNGHTADVIEALGFEVASLNVDRPTVYNPLIGWKLYRWLRKNPVDILHAASAEANFYSALVGKVAGVKTVIIEEIGIPTHSFFGRKLFHMAYKRADDFIWITQAVNDRLVELNEVKRGVGRLIHNPVSLPKVSRNFTGLPQNEPLVIAAVGRLVEVKNFQLLIRLVAQLNLEGISARLIIVGEGAQRSVLEALGVSLGVHNEVEMPGFAPNPNKLIAHAHLYIQPSLSEGFGISVVEAMMMGMPVIGSQVGGLQEIIDHGKNGWFMDPEAPVEALVSLVKSILKLDTGQLKKVCESARSMAIEKFSPSRYIQRLEAFYQTNYERH